VFGVIVKVPSPRSIDAGCGTSGSTRDAGRFVVVEACGPCGFGPCAQPAATAAAVAPTIKDPMDRRMLSLRTPDSALRTEHSALRTPHSALRTPHSALRTPHSALRV